jgi:hypothetical protein
MPGIAPAAGRPLVTSIVRFFVDGVSLLWKGSSCHGTVEASIDAFSTVEAGSVSYRNDANNGSVVVR